MNFYAFLGIFFIIEMALGHSTGHHQGVWWTRWSDSPLIILNLILLSSLYFIGWRRRKRRFPEKQKIANQQSLAFVAGLFFLVLALLSPIDTYSEELGWVHMLQHTCLMMIAAPLVAISSMGYVSQWFIPAKLWRWYWLLKKKLNPLGFRFWQQPLTITVLYGLTLWLWHIPLLYEAALKNSYVHDIQHLSFFLTSVWFWLVLLDPYSKNLLKPEVGILYLFVTSLHAMILGVLMALSPVVWYQPYLETAPLYGVTALEDQNLAGLIMWMPAGTTYVLVAVYLFLKLIHRVPSKI